MEKILIKIKTGSLGNFCTCFNIYSGLSIKYVALKATIHAFHAFSWKIDFPSINKTFSSQTHPRTFTYIAKISASPAYFCWHCIPQPIFKAFIVQTDLSSYYQQYFFFLPYQQKNLYHYIYPVHLFIASFHIC